jgi:hypothetical protein
MEFTNYILEAAGVSDVDIMDIEVTQAMAEMAVLEAMMDCYEKQMVLLEYNEDSADEIFTEAETFVPAMENDYFTEADTSMWAVRPKTDRGGKPTENGGFVVYDKGDPNKKQISPGSFSSEAEAQSWIRSQTAGTKDMVVRKAIDRGGNETDAYIVADQRDGRQLSPGSFPTAKEAEKWIKSKGGTPKPKRTTKKKKTIEKPAGEKPAASAQPQSDSQSDTQAPKQADQWDGSAKVSTASKSFSNSFKKFMSKAGSVIQQLVLGLVDSVFSVNFDKLATKIVEKGAGFTMNDKEFQTVNRLEDLMDLTQVYYGKFNLDLLSRVSWTRAEVGKYKNILSEASAALKQKYVDTGVFNDSTEQANSPNKQTTPEDLANLCQSLGKNEFKKLLRKCQKEAAAYNTDFNEKANIPPEIGKAMRTFVNDLIKVYNKTTKDFKGMLDFALEVGAVQEDRNRHGGIDQSPIGFKKSPKAKELQQRRRAARKAMRSGTAAVDMYENLGGKENANYDTNSWAEEGWSMNLSEDEDFF